MNFDIKDFKNPNLKDFDEYRQMYERSITDPSSFFLEHALKELDWRFIMKFYGFIIFNYF